MKIGMNALHWLALFLVLVTTTIGYRAAEGQSYGENALYAATTVWGNSSACVLLEIDESDGSATSIGNVGNSVTHCAGLGLLDNEIYALVYVAGGPHLATLNPVSGASTILHSSVSEFGLDSESITRVHPLNGVMYAVASNNSTNFYSISLDTGMASVVGDLGITRGSKQLVHQSLSSIDGTLYLAATLYDRSGNQLINPDARIYSINTSTGAATHVVDVDGDRTCVGIAKLGDTTYCAENDRLKTFNLATGAIGNLGSAEFGHNSNVRVGAFTSMFLAGAPHVPDAPTLTVEDATSIEVEWIAPNDGGSPITSYRVAYREVGQAAADDKVQDTRGTRVLISELTTGTEYQFRVRASNEIGDSDFSAESTETPAGGSDPPGDLTVEDGTAPFSADVSWTTPTDDGGSSILSYSLRYRPVFGASFSIRSGLTTTSTTVVNLFAGSHYEFQVAAVNAYGVGVYSDPVLYLTDGDVPDAPEEPRLLGSFKLVRVDWIAPWDNGDPIDHYEVRYREEAGAGWQSLPLVTGGKVQAFITNLQSPVEYRIQVRAHNANGYSLWSKARLITTHGPPAPPETPIVAPLSETSIRVIWFRPEERGESLTGYDLQFRDHRDNSWTQRSNIGTDRQYDITGLEPATTYVARVRARSVAGAGDWSEEGQATTTIQPLSDTVIEASAYLLDLPSVEELYRRESSDVNGGIRFRLTPAVGSVLGLQAVATPPLEFGWRISLFDNTDDTTATLSVDLPASTPELACGGTSVVRDSDVDMCEDGTTLTLDNVLTAEKITFQPYAYRASDTTYFRSAHTATYIAIPPPNIGNEIYFTFARPIAAGAWDHETETLTIQTLPVVGAQHTEVNINNSKFNYVFATPRSDTDRVVFTLRLHLPIETLPDRVLRWQVRNSVFAGDAPYSFTPEDSEPFTVPTHGWVYTPFTDPRYVDLLGSIATPTPRELLTDGTEAPELDESIARIARVVGIDQPDAWTQSIKAAGIFGGSFLVGFLVFWGTRRVNEIAAIITGVVVFSLLWLFIAPPVTGLSPTVVFPVMVLPVGIAILLVKRRLT